MAIILTKEASDKITGLNRKFRKFAEKGWMCEGGEYQGVPCNNLFNNDTGEFIKADYDGNILLTVVSHTSVKEAREMAKIQADIYNAARKDK